MNKTVFMFICLISMMFIISCKEDTSPIASVETPDWLLSYIEQIEDPSYYGAIIYQYRWNDNYYYDVLSDFDHA